MLKGRLKNNSLALKLLLFVGIMALCGVCVLFAFVLAANTAGLKILQLIQSMAVFCLPCFIAAWLFDDRPAAFLSLDKKPQVLTVVLVVVLMLSALPFINLIGWLNQHVHLPQFMSSVEQMLVEQEQAAEKLIESFLDVRTLGALLLNILVMALVPAFSEELCFRGVLQTLFASNGRRWVAVWVCAIIFSAVHFQFYGFIPRMLLGALFGYLLAYSGSIWLPVIAHFTNNVAVVVLYYIFKVNGKDTALLDTFGTQDTLWAGIVSGMITLILIILLFKILKKKNG